MTDARDMGRGGCAGMQIEIEDAPRPEDDSAEASPLPRYHELLSALSARFGIPGSPTFDSAMDWIDKHYVRRTR